MLRAPYNGSYRPRTRRLTAERVLSRAGAGAAETPLGTAAIVRAPCHPLQVACQTPAQHHPTLCTERGGEAELVGSTVI